MKFSDLPDLLPIFPLSEALLLPKGQLPLNIFEQRYIDMIDDVLGTHRIIGMVQPKSCEHESPSSVYQIGCAGRITSFEEQEKGRYIITLTGVSRFDIVKEVNSGTSYRQIAPCWRSYEKDIIGCCDCGLDIENFVKTLECYLTKMGMICEKWDEIKNIEEERLIAMISMVCPFSCEEKQALLEAETVADRADILITLMDMALRENAEKTIKH